MSEAQARGKGALAGIRVLDVAHQYSGALTASLLSDLGATVVSIEHPQGSPIRTMLPKRDNESLWWKAVQRGKTNITLNLSSPRGRELFLSLVKDFDFLIENFRPGTLERWKLGPADLEAAGANLSMLRISGFGQTGPLRDLPGFGTIAEAMSGFANLNGFPDGPPVFPSTTLADGVASVFGAFGVLAAHIARLRENKRGVEVVDVALFEGLFRLIPTQILSQDQLGVTPSRPGNFLSTHGVLRNLYLTRDKRYLCVSAVGPQAIRRIILAANATDLVARIDAGVMNEMPAVVEPFLIACNVILTEWANARTYDELAKLLSEAGAVFNRVYDTKDIVADTHYQARGDLVRVPDKDFGSILMQGIVPKFPGRDHSVSHAGQSRGADNLAFYRDRLGLTEDAIESLKADGII